MDVSDQKAQLNVELLASLIRQRRSREKLPLRDAAQMCGVAFSTLSRLERGQGGNLI